MDIYIVEHGYEYEQADILYVTDIYDDAKNMVEQLITHFKSKRRSIPNYDFIETHTNHWHETRGSMYLSISSYKLGDKTDLNEMYFNE